MCAVGIRRYGPPEVLENLEVERPDPAPDGVLIRIAAAGINPADAYLRAGRFRFVARQKMPFVPGSDVAGVVEAAGPDAGRFRPGDPVYAMLPSMAGGGYAGFAATPAAHVAPAPPGITLGEAAAVPLAALTALQALRDKAGLAPGDRVLVNGASGGVGTFAVQIARAMGAAVTAVTSGRNADLVRGLGACEVLDYTREDVTVGGTRYDVVFDAAGVHPFRRWRRVLNKGGVAVTVNPLLGNPASRLLSRVGGAKRLESLLVRPDGADLERVGAWISSGDVKPVIERSHPLAEAPDAHRRIEGRRTRGKIVLVVDQKLAAKRAQIAPVRAIQPMG